jgi:lactate dehydrogenase-like 2-hydroxyacid dehydrogenase
MHIYNTMVNSTMVNSVATRLSSLAMTTSIMQIYNAMVNSVATRLSSPAMTTTSTSPTPEHLLLIFPFPKPTALINALSTRHPYLKITYVELTRDCTKDLTNQPQVPDSLFADATILGTLFSFPSTPAIAKNLKFIHLISTGSNQVQNKRIWKETDVVITTNSGIHSPMISEWVVLQMLTHSHKQKLLLEWQKEHFWGPHAAVQERSDYVGQRIGVLGYGSIGRQGL